MDSSDAIPRPTGSLNSLIAYGFGLTYTPAGEPESAIAKVVHSVGKFTRLPTARTGAWIDKQLVGSVFAVIVALLVLEQVGRVCSAMRAIGG